MPEEQMLDTATFAEVNAQHALGDVPVGEPANVPAEPAKAEPPAEPVNWETKYKEFETTTSKEKEALLNEKKTYEQKIEELSKRPPPVTHKNSDYSRLEVLHETAPEKVPLFQKLLWGNPNAEELWKLDFVEKNPDYKDDPETVQMMLEAEFEHYFDGTDKEDKEFKIASNRLKIAGNQIKAAKLAEFKGIQVSDPQQAEKSMEDRKKELATSWEIPFSELTKTPLKVSQKIVLDDKSEVEVDFGIQPEDVKKYNDLMGLFILHNDLKPTAENAQRAREYATGEIQREKFVDILKATFQKEFNRRYDEWQKTRNNNRPLAPAFTSDDKKSKDQDIMNLMQTGEVYVPNT
jgi:hypothetical protein